MKKYSANTGGFYATEIHGENIPGDAVDVTDEQYSALFAGQGQGKMIVADNSGCPVLADQPAQTVEQLAESARAKRNSLLASCDWTVLPDSPLLPAVVAEWKVYRQDLRNISNQSEFPTNINWPTTPR